MSIPTISTVGLNSGVVPTGSAVTLNCSSPDAGVSLSWVNVAGKIASHNSILTFQKINKQNTDTYRCKSQKEDIITYSEDVPVNVSCMLCYFIFMFLFWNIAQFIFTHVSEEKEKK